MSDRGMRRLERRYKEGDPQAGDDLIRARVRLGQAQPAVLRIDRRDRRQRVRKVNDHAMIVTAQRKAIRDQEWVIEAEHGGTVPNSYRYPAETEAVVVVCDLQGRCVRWLDRVPANKATLRGVAAALFQGTEVADLWDGRIKDADRVRKAREVIYREFALIWHDAATGQLSVQIEAGLA